jgi:ketosteroid isomerase-like protein
VSNVQVIRDAYDCFSRGDIPTLLGLMDSDIEWSEAEGNPYQPSGKAWRGPDAIVQNLFMKIGADFDGTFVIHPKDKSLDAQFCHVFKVRDGKVTSFQQFVDTAQMQDVMGAR